jgi:hypothetical protein
MPLRLLNINSGYPDVALEAKRIRKGFNALLASREPLEIQAAYKEILDTNHPVELMQTLGEMAKGLPVPALVGFNAQGQHRGRDSPDVKVAKDQFETMNDRVFESAWQIPPLKRDQSVEEKLANFLPGGYRDQRATPKVAKLQLTLDRSKRLTVAGAPGELRALLTVRNMSIAHSNLQVYVRIEQHGALNLGRFVQTEHIVNMAPEFATTASGTIWNRTETFQFALNGVSGVLPNTEFLDEAIISGDSFDMHISVSEDGETWSQEQSLSFAIYNGVLQNL